MKTTIKKLISVMLCALFVINLVPASAFATYTMSDKAEEALAFVESKGFAVGDVQAVYENGDSLKFDVKYLSSGETSYIEYTENYDGVTLVLTEGVKKDTIVFKDSGKVYWDGKETDDFITGNTPALTATYASYFTDTSPALANNSYPNYWGSVGTATYVLEKVIKDMTVSALKAAILSFLGIPTNLGVIDTVATTLINYAINDNTITYSGPVYRNTSQGPLQYFYKYTVTLTSGGRSTTAVYYKVEQLV